MAYTLITTQTLIASSGTVTFSNIPGTFKDLMLECVGTVASSTPALYIRFNGDTGTNYSYTGLQGDGSTATSSRQSNISTNQLNFAGGPNGTTPYVITANIMSYANTSVNKTTVSRASNAAGGASSVVNLWRSTAAITSFVLSMSSGDIGSGSTFKLWGVS